MTADDQSDRVRRLLKELPQVPAKPDFEERLGRRLASERGRRSAWRWFVFRPAFAYPALTVVVAGVISYLALERSGELPGPEPRTLVAESTAASGGTPEGAPLAAGAPPQPDAQRQAAKETLHERPAVQAVPREYSPAIVEAPAAKADQAPSPARMFEKSATPVAGAAKADARAAAAPSFAVSIQADTLVLSARELAIIDSVARTDSMKADSLRRAFLRARRERKP